MISELSPREFEAILRSDLGCFAERCFYQLNPPAAFLMNWHIEVIAAKLTAVREGKIRRLIINLPLAVCSQKCAVSGSVIGVGYFFASAITRAPECRLRRRGERQADRRSRARWRGRSSAPGLSDGLRRATGAPPR